MKTKIVSLLLASPLFLPMIVSAQQPVGSGISTVKTLPQGSVFNFNALLRILNTFIDYLFTILLVLSVVFILWAAFKYLTAGGEEEKIGKAHQILLWAVIAIAVALLSQGVMFLVANIVGSSIRQ